MKAETDKLFQSSFNRFEYLIVPLAICSRIAVQTADTLYQSQRLETLTASAIKICWLINTLATVIASTRRQDYHPLITCLNMESGNQPQGWQTGQTGPKADLAPHRFQLWTPSSVDLRTSHLDTLNWCPNLITFSCSMPAAFSKQ